MEAWGWGEELRGPLRWQGPGHPHLQLSYWTWRKVVAKGTLSQRGPVIRLLWPAGDLPSSCLPVAGLLLVRSGLSSGWNKYN